MSIAQATIDSISALGSITEKSTQPSNGFMNTFVTIILIPLSIVLIEWLKKFLNPDKTAKELEKIKVEINDIKNFSKEINDDTKILIDNQLIVKETMFEINRTLAETHFDIILLSDDKEHFMNTDDTLERVNLHLTMLRSSVSMAIYNSHETTPNRRKSQLNVRLSKVFGDFIENIAEMKMRIASNGILNTSEWFVLFKPHIENYARMLIEVEHNINGNEMGEWLLNINTIIFTSFKKSLKEGKTIMKDDKKFLVLDTEVINTLEELETYEV